MKAALDFIKASMLSSNLLNFFPLVNFGRRKMGLDWGNLLDEWDGENYRESLAWENCSGTKRNLGDFSNRGCTSVSTDCVAAVSRPHSCVRRHLVSLENRILFKNIVWCLTV